MVAGLILYRSSFLFFSGPLFSQTMERPSTHTHIVDQCHSLEYQILEILFIISQMAARHTVTQTVIYTQLYKNKNIGNTEII